MACAGSVGYETAKHTTPKLLQIELYAGLPCVHPAQLYATLGAQFSSTPEFFQVPMGMLKLISQKDLTISFPLELDSSAADYTKLSSKQRWDLVKEDIAIAHQAFHGKPMQPEDSMTEIEDLSVFTMAYPNRSALLKIQNDICLMYSEDPFTLRRNTTVALRSWKRGTKGFTLPDRCLHLFPLEIRQPFIHALSLGSNCFVNIQNVIAVLEKYSIKIK